MKFRVTAGYDCEGIYFVYSSEIPGLYAEARTLGGLVEIIREVAPSLTRDKSALVALTPGIVFCSRERSQAKPAIRTR